MLSAIWSSPDFAEVMFLVAVILFAAAAIVKLMRNATIVPFIELGLTATALGFLAL